VVIGEGVTGYNSEVEMIQAAREKQRHADLLGYARVMARKRIKRDHAFWPEQVVAYENELHEDLTDVVTTLLAVLKGTSTACLGSEIMRDLEKAFEIAKLCFNGRDASEEDQ
jgi:hypothetical protein